MEDAEIMNKNFRVIALAFAIIAMLSMFTLSVFAAEETTAAVTTTAADGTTTAEPSTTTAPSTNNTKKDAGLKTYEIVSLIALGAVIVVAAIVVFAVPSIRTKTVTLFRSLKSEWKKISWYSWKNTQKGTLVVVVLVLVIAAVILLLDTLFPSGIALLEEAING